MTPPPLSPAQIGTIRDGLDEALALIADAQRTAMSADALRIALVNVRVEVEWTREALAPPRRGRPRQHRATADRPALRREAAHA